MPANGGFLWLVLHIHVCCDGVRSAHLQKKVAQDWKTTVSEWTQIMLRLQRAGLHFLPAPTQPEV